MLEFLLCAAANAAKFNGGYCGIEKSPPLFIAAAYCAYANRFNYDLSKNYVSCLLATTIYIYVLTWWAAEIRAGSKAENAAAAAAAEDAEKCPLFVVDEADAGDELTPPPPLDAFRRDDKFTYGATRHASSGVAIGGLWLDSIIPGAQKKKMLLKMTFVRFSITKDLLLPNDLLGCDRLFYIC